MCCYVASEVEEAFGIVQHVCRRHHLTPYPTEEQKEAIAIIEVDGYQVYEEWHWKPTFAPGTEDFTVDRTDPDRVLKVAKMIAEQHGNEAGISEYGVEAGRNFWHRLHGAKAKAADGEEEEDWYHEV